MRLAKYKKNNIYYFKTLSSTMDVASELADQGCPDFTVVVAEEQSSGCGRMDRTWHSKLGGLYFSIIVRPNISVDLSAHIGFAVSLDIVKTLRALFGVEANLKWPNDVLIKNRKICGILSRVKIKKNIIVYANIGVGLNVSNNPGAFDPNAISLYDILGKKVENSEILATFLNSFKVRMSNFNVERVSEEWKELNITLGRLIKIVTLKDQVEGIASDLDLYGGLKVLMADGSIKTIAYGDCFHC